MVVLLPSHFHTLNTVTKHWIFDWGMNEYDRVVSEYIVFKSYGWWWWCMRLHCRGWLQYHTPMGIKCWITNWIASFTFLNSNGKYHQKHWLKSSEHFKFCFVWVVEYLLLCTYFLETKTKIIEEEVSGIQQKYKEDKFSRNDINLKGEIV